MLVSEWICNWIERKRERKRGKSEMTAKVTAADLPVARAEEENQATGAGAYNGGNSKCYVETAARVAAAGKKTLAQTRKKATGAADGK